MEIRETSFILNTSAFAESLYCVSSCFFFASKVLSFFKLHHFSNIFQIKSIITSMFS